MDDTKIFIVGANGQLGTALQARYPNARSADISQLDITDADSVANFNWAGISVIINAAAYTNVDGAETDDGRITAWNVNATAVANLAKAALNRNITLIHISTDYVFDGSNDPHTETEPFSPLSVYGETKAAGDLVVSVLPKHYILRTSWVIGQGKNFVRTMLSLGQRGISPTVVSDQIGRLTFTSELVRAIDHLLTIKAAYGTYNVSNSGDAVSWADITREIFKLADYKDLSVSDVTTADYYAGKDGIAPRPLQSTLNLNKLLATDFKPVDWNDDLRQYIKKELTQ